MIITLAQDATANDAYLYWGFILLAVALVLLFAELLVPSGGLIGLLCGVAIIGSVISFFRYDTTWGITASALYIVLGPISLVFIFKVWIHSPLGRRMILTTDVNSHETDPLQEGSSAEHDRRERLAQLQALVGAEGMVVTDLRPVGVIKINGERIDALAENSVIDTGTAVIVTDVYDNQVKVRPA